MKTFATTAMFACLVLGTAAASAQTTTAPMGKQAAKVTQDCKDRTATQMGQKRSDAAVNGDVAAACADAPLKAHSKKKAMKHDAAASAM